MSGGAGEKAEIIASARYYGHDSGVGECLADAKVENAGHRLRTQTPDPKKTDGAGLRHRDGHRDGLSEAEGNTTRAIESTLSAEIAAVHI